RHTNMIAVRIQMDFSSGVYQGTGAMTLVTLVPTQNDSYCSEDCIATVPPAHGRSAPFAASAGQVARCRCGARPLRFQPSANASGARVFAPAARALFARPRGR